LRGVASLGATGLGALLLLADSNGESGVNDCKALAAFHGEFDFVTDCEGLSAEGHVVLDWAAGHSVADVDTALLQGLLAGRLQVSSAAVSWADGCTPASMGWTFEDSAYDAEVSCREIPVPVVEETHIPCATRRSLLEGAGPVCTFIVTPSPTP